MLKKNYYYIFGDFKLKLKFNKSAKRENVRPPSRRAHAYAIPEGKNMFFQGKELISRMRNSSGESE